jgi:3-deoxy-7-phosphoheptulonate synthase
VILRGGKTPNYDTETVSQLVESLRDNDVPGNKVMIDASHGNSNKKPENQLLVCKDICTRVANGNKDIFGVMVESNLVGGRQDLVTGKGLDGLIYGKSITDACISWQETDKLFTEFSNAIKEFRKR